MRAESTAWNNLSHSRHFKSIQYSITFFPSHHWNFLSQISFLTFQIRSGISSLDFISVGGERNCAKMIRSIYKSDYRDPQQIMRDDKLESNLRHKKSICVGRTSSEVEVSSLMKEQKPREEVRRHCWSAKMSGRSQEDNNDSMRLTTPLSGTHCSHRLTSPPQSEAADKVGKPETSS